MRVLVIDDHPVVRDGLASMIAAEADMEIVGQAGDGESGVRHALEQRPDVITMDMHMPDMSGATAIRRIMDAAATPRGAWRPQIIALSAADDDESIVAAISAGACAYLPKSSTHADIVAAVRAAGNGEKILYSSVAHTLARQTPKHVLPHPLSTREDSVLQLLAAGLSTAQIAEHMVLEHSTVKTHIEHNLKKLDAANRAQAIARAHALGLIRVDPAERA